MTENEMHGWHHQFIGHESEQTPGDNKGQKLYGLTEAEDSKERWQEYTKELYNRVLTMPKPLTGWITINCGKF